jgi:hypothetical protein
MTTTRVLRFAAALITVAGMLAACSSLADRSDTVAATAPASSAIATTSASVQSVGPTAPPSTSSQVPDGVYRTSLTKDEVLAAGGYDPSSAGTWTLTLKRGTYQLECVWVDDDGDDCGHSGHKKMIVEAGKTAGDATYLWFEYSKAETTKLNGMPDGNPSDGNYRVSWRLQGSDLVMTHVWVGPSVGSQPDDVNNVTIKPWKKIS